MYYKILYNVIQVGISDIIILSFIIYCNINFSLYNQWNLIRIILILILH